MLVADYSYLGVFLFLIACGLGFPSPEEVALIGGGYAVWKAGGGWPHVTLMVSIAMFGVLVGDCMLYGIGRRVGDHPERVPIIGRHLTPKRMDRARRLFHRHGAKAVFFGRFLFGIRAVTFFVSGSLRVPIVTFILMDGLAALLSVPISIVLAWWFGGELEQAFETVGGVHKVLLAIVSVAGVVFCVSLYRQWRQRGSAMFGLGESSDELSPEADAADADAEAEAPDAEAPDAETPDAPRASEPASAASEPARASED